MTTMYVHARSQRPLFVVEAKAEAEAKADDAEAEATSDAAAKETDAKV